MNKQLHIFFFAVFGLVAGSTLAVLYTPKNHNLPQEENLLVHKLKDESLAKGINFISSMDAVSIDEIITNYLSLSEKDMNEKMRFFFLSAIDLYVCESPDTAISLFKSSKFSRASQFIKNFYAYYCFSSLAYHYPERFIAYLLWLNEGRNAFSEFQYEAASGFFNKLNEKNPQLSYTLLTDESLNELRELEVSNHVPPHITKLRTHFDSWEKAAIGNIGLDNESLFLSKLESMSKSYWERHQFLCSLINHGVKQSDIDLIAWAKENLSEENKDIFFNALLQKKINGNNSWRNAWEFANQIGLENMGPSSLNQIIQKAIKEDTLAAIEIIETSLKGHNREVALANVLLELNKKQTPAEMLPIINGLSDGICKDQVIPAFFEKYLTESPEEAVAWALAKREISSYKFFDNYLYPTFSKSSEYSQKIALLFWNAEKSNDDVKGTIASIFACNNSAAGIEFMGKLPDGERIAYAKNFYKSMSSSNAIGAIKSIKESQLFGENKTELTKEVVKQVSCTFPPTQLAAVLKETNDPELTRYAAEQYVWAFDREFSGDKENYIERALSDKLPEDFKKELSAALEAKRNGMPRPEDAGNLIIILPQLNVSGSLIIR